MIIFQSGDVFVGRYRLDAQIGHGGMAAVWRATQLTLNRAVAVKLILPTAYDDPMYRELFATEARLSAKLVHPNIVPVLDYGETMNILFLVQQFISGRDLAQVIQSAPQGLPEPIALYITTQCLYGLQCAHEEHVIHRDIKPANVLISTSGNVQLSDFGIAKSVTPGNRSISTMIKGSPGYMAPEVLRGQASSEASDLFAIGSMLWELLTGQNLFASGNPDRDQVFFNTLNRETPTLASAGVRVHPGLDEILRRLLARDPSNRYQRAGEVLDDLLPIVTAMGATATAQELRRFLPSTLDTIMPDAGLRPPTPGLGAMQQPRVPSLEPVRQSVRDPRPSSRPQSVLPPGDNRTPSLSGQMLPSVPSRGRSRRTLWAGAGVVVVVAGMVVAMLIGRNHADQAAESPEPAAAAHGGVVDAGSAPVPSPVHAAVAVDAGPRVVPVAVPPSVPPALPPERADPVPRPVVTPLPPPSPSTHKPSHTPTTKPRSGTHHDNNDEETLPL